MAYNGNHEGLLASLPEDFAANDAMEELQHLIVPTRVKKCKAKVKREQQDSAQQQATAPATAQSNHADSTEARKCAAAQASKPELPKRFKTEEQQEKNTANQDADAKGREQKASSSSGSREQPDGEQIQDDQMPTTPKRKKQRIPDKEDASPARAEKKKQNDKQKKGTNWFVPRPRWRRPGSN